MIRPDIIGIGGQRCGSTTIYRWLRRHPDVYTKTKEIHYFDREIQTVDAQWYSDHFKEGHINIDVTPAYSTISPGMVRQVKKYTPDAKIIFFVRNPIQRVLSIVRAAPVFKGQTNLVYKNEVLLSEELIRSVSDPRSDYDYTIQTWRDVFEDQFGIFYFDDFTTRPDELGKDLEEFLGIEVPGPTFEKANASSFLILNPKIIEQLIIDFEPKLKVWRRFLDSSIIDRWRAENDEYLQKMRRYHDHFSTKQTGIDT